EEIIVPEFGKSVAELGWIKRAEKINSKFQVDLVLPTFALRSERECAAKVKEAAILLTSAGMEVELNVFAEVQPAVKQSIKKEGIADIRNVILVVSGKGGVGKSTVAANLAQALAKLGCRTGLLDADVYGPSVPTLFDISKDAEIFGIKKEGSSENYMIPLEKNGIKLMSLGFLVDTSAAMIWRGPMIASAAMQMFYNVAWGDLDYLIVDMPPGTGDIHLTISQKVTVAGGIIVSTPHELALADLRRAKAMLDKVSIPIFGLVENMSYFKCDGCDKRHEIFSHGKAAELAKQIGVKVLSEIPLREGLEFSDPVYEELAHDMAEELAKVAYNRPPAPKEKVRLNVIG
ncbi:MAG: Mrp/NBP35 family ATP-binding protein, partial [Deltaproteobacteria bacterium]|nr:Mrp/NBP35 family ATP-binding protein [Deltaproteobacteria bacterium]